MPRLSTFSVLLLLAFAVPVTDVMAQSSAGRGAVGGAIIGGAVGGRRGRPWELPPAPLSEPIIATGIGMAITTGGMAVAGSAPAGGRIRYLRAIAGKLRVPYGPSAFPM